jgi:hypothetical protein
MVRAPIETIHTFIQQACAAHGFRVKLTNPYGGKAEKKGAPTKVPGEAPPESYTVDFEILRLESVSVVRLHRLNKGAAGGSPVAPATSKQFEQLVDALAMWFNQHGCLQGILGL